MTPLVVARRQSVARPLKVLVPLIKAKLVQVENAGLEEKRETGELLIEAKAQVPLGSWGPWLNRNFHLSATTARNYMQLARKIDESESTTGGVAPKSLNESRGKTQYERNLRAAWQPTFAATRDVDVETIAQERQTRRDEITLHRELALELIDIGWKALATRLHPDRGGSREAMLRLNRVREQLKEVAAMRRFV
jgi:hypothetical protein